MESKRNAIPIVFYLAPTFRGRERCKTEVKNMVKIIQNFKFSRSARAAWQEECKSSTIGIYQPHTHGSFLEYDSPVRCFRERNRLKGIALTQISKHNFWFIDLVFLLVKYTCLTFMKNLKLRMFNERIILNGIEEVIAELGKFRLVFFYCIFTG